MATVNLRIGPADNGRRITLEEFREAEEQPGSFMNCLVECSK